MNGRLKRFLVGVMVGSTLFCVVPKADTLTGNEEVVQESDNEGICETIYSRIADGRGIIDVLNGEELGIRASIGVDTPPRGITKGSNMKNVVNSDDLSSDEDNIGAKIADFAKGLVGKPYSYGSVGPNSFDCSGFVVYVYGIFGIDLPRASQSQAYSGDRISRSDLKPGDLVFSNTYSSLSHVGVYLGDGKFVHAASPSSGVTISSINDDYYGSRYAWATRVY